MTSQNSPRIVALVPMRHTSDRVQGKNYRDMAGKPLYQHIVETLLACTEIDEVVVDTDSTVILAELRENFSEVTVLERPENLRDERISMNEILLHDTAQVSADYYLQTHSTNPLLRSETISSAVNAFLSNRTKHDSLFSVTALQTRFYDQHGKAINHNPDELLRTQDLPPIYEENSCIYIFDRQTLMERGNRLGHSPMMFPIEAKEAWDIDEEIDFLVTDFLMRQRHGR